MIDACHSVVPIGVGIEGRQQQEINKVQRNVHDDEQQFQRGKLERSAAKPQVSKRDALKGIDGHAHRHHSEKFGVGGITQHVGNGRKETQDGSTEEQPHAPHGDECGGINTHPFRFVRSLVYETEESGFHAESQEHQQQSHETINLSDDTIATARSSQLCRVERHEQVIEKTPHNAAQSVDGSFFG